MLQYISMIFYAFFTFHKQQRKNCPNAKVISFGGNKTDDQTHTQLFLLIIMSFFIQLILTGSYGGMLTAWFRIKYPHIVTGAIAASAPIWQFTDITPPTSYNNITTRTFLNSQNGPNCVDGFTKSWNIIRKYASTPEGRDTLTSVFGFCDSLHDVSPVNTTNLIFTWMNGALSSLPMADYPYNATVKTKHIRHFFLSLLHFILFSVSRSSSSISS